MKKQYNFDKYSFATQKELNLTIKQMISEAPRNIEFKNDFLTSLINNLHESVKIFSLKVTKFKILDWYGQIDEWAWVRERFRGGIYVLGFFEPINKWHGVTLYPHKKVSCKQNIINALRQKWSEKAEKPNGRLCSICKANNPELHHKNISFDCIAKQCLFLFSDEEVKIGCGNWWEHENEADALSNNHPAVLKMFELHQDVTYDWLCYDCHKKEHKKDDTAKTTN